MSPLCIFLPFLPYHSRSTVYVTCSAMCVGSIALPPTLPAQLSIVGLITWFPVMQLLPMLPALLHHCLVVDVNTLGILPASFLHQPSQQTLVNISSIPWVPSSPRSSPVQPPMWLALPSLSQCCSWQFLHPASLFLLSTSSADTHDDSRLLQHFLRWSIAHAFLRTYSLLLAAGAAFCCWSSLILWT